MKADNQHMDDIFRKAAAEQQFPYRSDFWNEMQAQLNDDALDAAFLTAAGTVVVMPEINLAEAMEDAFLDDAFKSAAEKYTADFPANAWTQFLNDAAAIEQDSAFMTAANSVTADYHPAFWSDADQALQNEGLHYEYRSAYWNDAKNLLDHADRKIFFFRWSAVAAVLLLLSFGGIYQSFNNDQVSMPLASDTSLNEKQNYQAENNNTPSSNYNAAINNQSTLPVEKITVHQPAESNSGIVQNHEPVLQHNTDLLIDSPIHTAENNESITEFQTTTAINTNSVTNHAETETSENATLLNPLENNTAVVQITNRENTVLQLSEIDLSTNLSPLPGQDINTLDPTLVTSYLGPQIKIERFKLSPMHTLSFVGNAGIGNKYGEPDFTPSFRTSFGLEYNHTGFGRMRNFELGGGFSMNHVRQNNFGTERRVSVFNLQGGVDKFWYKLQFKDMIYANANVFTSYRLNKRNSVRLSLGLDYLVFVQSNMSYKVNADQEITTVNNNWGVKDGLTKIDARVGLGYEFAVTQRFAVQMNGSFGFMDRTDDEFISKNVFDHEMNATVGLKYTFLRKL